MRRSPVLAVAAFCLLLQGCIWSPSEAQTTTIVREIAPGLNYTQETSTGTAPLIVHVLHIDRHTKDIHLAAGQALDVVSYGGTAQGRETMSQMAARTGAIAAINGDYFPYNGDPTSLEIRDGELISEPIGFRAAVGLTRDAALMEILTSRGVVTMADRLEIVLNGINHLPHPGETVLLTSTYQARVKLKEAALILTVTGCPLPVHVSRDLAGTVSAITPLTPDQWLPPCPVGSLQIVAVGSATAPFAAHCKPGDSLTVRYDLLPVGPRGTATPQPEPTRSVWQDVEQAIGGGPWLVRDGKTFVDGDAEKRSLTTFVNARHPRSAVGICADGSLILVAVDGRKAMSRGVTLPELAEIMKRYGAQQAINLDGGGSTDMVVAGSVVNMPSDGRERPVANGLLVFADAQKAVESSRLRIAAEQNPTLTLHAGETMALGVVTADGQPVKDPILWGTRNGLGFVDAQGVFHGFAAGTGTALARVGSERISATVTVLPAAPTTVKAAFAPPAPGASTDQRATLTITDSYGNATPDVTPALTVEGGTTDLIKPTDGRGQIVVVVHWTAGAPKRMLHATLAGHPTVDFAPTAKPVSEPSEP